MQEDDKVRFEKEVDELRTKGFFINEDGVKSYELKKKRTKAEILKEKELKTKLKEKEQILKEKENVKS
jgi:hypothetical protein